MENDPIEILTVFWPHVLMVAAAVIIFYRFRQRYPTYPRKRVQPFALGVVALTLTTIAVFLPKVLSQVVFMVGWVIGVIAVVTGYKQFFCKRMSEEEIKRQVDPGYDLDYTLCPHCNKTMIRRDASPHRCPICHTSISRSSASNKPPS